MYRKLTPVLIVPSIEPVLPLWEALGFQRTVEVPHGDALGFVILVADGIEVMYQTVDSVRADAAQSIEGPKPAEAAALFIEVDDLDAVAARIPADADVFIRRRTTPYGATETWLRDGSGNVIGFAQMG